MILSTLLTALTISPWYGALAGQIPTVDGILGGVPTTIPDTFRAADALPLGVAATTPGKLRVVENSGVCGGYRHSTTVLAYFDVCAILETTPGVFQASGYGDLTATESIWFVSLSYSASRKPLIFYKVLVLRSAK